MTAVADPCHTDTPDKTTTIRHNKPGRSNSKSTDCQVFGIKESR